MCQKSVLILSKNGLPDELKNINIDFDFVWTEKVFEMGVLRLQPKVLKLPEINASNVPLLRSRGIKSSTRDPIRIIQKILDTIFNHLLFHIENQFISQFGVFSPSVLGVQEAIS